jgi:hypothetical protein
VRAAWRCAWRAAFDVDFDLTGWAVISLERFRNHFELCSQGHVGLFLRKRPAGHVSSVGTHCEKALAEGQFVGGLERCAAEAADDRRAVAADEGVGDDAGASGAPEVRVGWLGIRLGDRFGRTGEWLLGIWQHPRRA